MNWVQQICDEALSFGIQRTDRHRELTDIMSITLIYIFFQFLKNTLHFICQLIYN